MRRNRRRRRGRSRGLSAQTPGPPRVPLGVPVSHLTAFLPSDLSCLFWWSCPPAHGGGEQRQRSHEVVGRDAFKREVPSAEGGPRHRRFQGRRAAPVRFSHFGLEFNSLA